MTLGSLVKRELLERKHQLATSFLTILLGVAAIVSINSIAHFSEVAISEQLGRLGANVLVLPRDASVQNYYAADLNAGTLPEEHVERLAASGLHGMENLSPKLSQSVKIGSRDFILTGILPKSEIRGKSLWQTPLGFTAASAAKCAPLDLTTLSRDEQLARKRVIDELKSMELFVGSEAAVALSLKPGDRLQLVEREFAVAAVLPPTGTVDDSRLFGHLRTVQEIFDRRGQVNAIEVVGCCKEIFAGLTDKLSQLLPDAKIVTIGQVVSTQLSANQTMNRLSWIFLGLIVLVGGAGIANYMFGNVHERQKEIGTLMALGADSRFVTKLFMAKAAILGLAGGFGGYLTGTGLAMLLGPRVAQIQVSPLPALLLVALGVALGVSLVASYWPARRAAGIDPCIAFRDV